MYEYRVLTMPKYNQTRNASKNIQRLSIASILIQGQANKIKIKIRRQTISLVDQNFSSKHIFSNIQGPGN